jgi:hypothetical protein
LIDFLKQNDEFIASLATSRVGAADAIAQAVCYALQELVACGMSQGIVDVFETIHIQKEQRHLFFASGRSPG